MTLPWTSPGSLKFTFRGALCITLCQHNLFSTARSLQSVSSETVPQQLMYKLQPTGARGWAKIGPLLEVIFHSISNFVFSPSLWSSIPTVILCLLHVFNVYLRFLCQWCNPSAFSAREVDTVYASLLWRWETETQVLTSDQAHGSSSTKSVSAPLPVGSGLLRSPAHSEPVQKNMLVQHRPRTKASPRRNAGVIPSGHFWCSHISSSDICCMSRFTCWSCRFQQRH